MAAKATPRKATPKAEDSGDVETPEGFTWEPKDGGEPITLPPFNTVRPRNKAMWFEYQLEKRSYSMVAQIRFMLECAAVPEVVCDCIFDLSDEELLDLINGWSSSVAGASLGES